LDPHSHPLSVANVAELTAFKSEHKVPVKHSPCNFNFPKSLQLKQYLLVVSGKLPVEQPVELTHVLVVGSK